VKDNYYVTFDYGKLLVTPRIITFAVIATPEEFAWEDGVSHFPTSIVVKDGEAELEKDKDYFYKETPEVDVGKYTITVTGRGNYAGSSGCTNFWITAYDVTYLTEGVEDSKTDIGEVSGTDVFANCPEKEGYCVDVQNSVTNGTVTRIDDGLLHLTVRYEKDSNDDDIPDKYQRKITFRVVNGWWDDDKTKATAGSGKRCVWVTKFKMDGETMTEIWDVNGTGKLEGKDVPAVGNNPFQGPFAKGGAWWPVTPYDGMMVTNATSPLFIFGYNHAAGGGSHRPGGSAQPPKFSVVPDISTFAYVEGKATFAVNQKAYDNGTLVVSMPLEATRVTVEGKVSLSDETWQPLATKDTNADGYVTVDELGDFQFFRISVELQ